DSCLRPIVKQHLFSYIRKILLLLIFYHMSQFHNCSFSKYNNVPNFDFVFYKTEIMRLVDRLIKHLYGLLLAWMRYILRSPDYHGLYLDLPFDRGTLVEKCFPSDRPPSRSCVPPEIFRDFHFKYFLTESFLS